MSPTIWYFASGRSDKSRLTLLDTLYLSSWVLGYFLVKGCVGESIKGDIGCWGIDIGRMDVLDVSNFPFGLFGFLPPFLLFFPPHTYLSLIVLET